MQEVQQRVRIARLASAADGVWPAIRFVMVAAAAVVGFLAVGTMWMSTCAGALGADPVACGPIPNTLRGVGAPVIALTAAGWSFWRAYGARRGGGPLAAWHASGWFLLILAGITLLPGT
ncbi:hypothetical protein B1R94_21500 [Mycolicibacterium litorale]|nr:hypothetical protein B1R94_21500 [Mycolicibacterium litorale]